MRGSLYQQAAYKAFSQGDVERARQIVSENITNSMERDRLLKDFDRHLLLRASEQGRMGEVQQLLSRVRSDQERAAILTQLATAAARQGEKARALEFLDEARVLVGGRTENYPQVDAQLQIARGYATLQASQSAEMLVPLIEKLNELTAAASVLDGFEIQGHFRGGELVLQGGNVLTSMVRQCGEILGWLAPADFDLALLVANRLHRPETRVMICVLIAQRVFAGTPAVRR